MVVRSRAGLPAAPPCRERGGGAHLLAQKGGNAQPHSARKPGRVGPVRRRPISPRVDPHAAARRQLRGPRRGLRECESCGGERELQANMPSPAQGALGCMKGRGPDALE